MKVYVLTSYTTDSEHIEGIFSTEYLAGYARAALESKDYLRWKQWLTDDDIEPSSESIRELMDIYAIKEYQVDKEIT